MSKILTKEEILAAEDLPTQEIEVPEWGGSVIVRPLTGSERDAFEGSVLRGVGNKAKVDMTHVRAKLVGLCVINKDGKRLFASQEEVILLGRKNGKVLDRLFQIAQSLSGLSDKAVEELTEGLEPAQNAGSTSN